VSGPGVGARWLLPTQSVSGHAIRDRLHLVRSEALELRQVSRTGAPGARLEQQNATTGQIGAPL